MMLLKKTMLLALFRCGFPVGSRAEAGEGKGADRLSICYNINIPPGQFEPFNLLLVDSAYPVDSVKLLREKGKTVFGYLSLGALEPWGNTGGGFNRSQKPGLCGGKTRALTAK